MINELLLMKLNFYINFNLKLKKPSSAQLY